MLRVFRRQLWVSFFGLSGLFLCAYAGKKTSVPPAAGWCRTKHRPPKAAQSAACFKGYCKACFKEKFPKEHAKKQQERISETCGSCRQKKETDAAGYCRPCRNARCCDLCGEMNVNRKSPQCARCEIKRSALGACQPRLALWCLSCTTETDRGTKVCRI